MTRRPLRVVLVGGGRIPIPPPDYGAIEKHIWYLAQELEKLGHSVRIVNKVFGPEYRHEYPFARWARRELRAEPYDVVHVQTPVVANLFHLTGVPYVYTTQSRHWSGTNGWSQRFGHLLETRAVAHASQAIAVSSFVADLIDRPTHVVPNGVNVDVYAPRPEQRTGRRVVGVGEVVHHKQWHVAAEALRGMDATLEVAGPIRDVAYADRLEASGARLMGSLAEPDLARFLGEADILVHPTISESFGMAVVEGMSAGLPVVCSDMLSFLVTEGTHGLHVPTRASDEVRIEAMRDCLARLLADAPLRHALGEAARDKAVAGYSWPSVAAGVERVYRMVVA